MSEKKMDAVVKKPTECAPDELGAFQKLAEKSDRFNYDPGWLYVKPEARGKGLGHSLIKAVVSYLDGSSCYATTRENNDSMHHLFSQYNFNRLGAAYPSDNGYSLVRYANKP